MSYELRVVLIKTPPSPPQKKKKKKKSYLNPYKGVWIIFTDELRPVLKLKDMPNEKVFQLVPIKKSRSQRK